MLSWTCNCQTLLYSSSAAVLTPHVMADRFTRWRDFSLHVRGRDVAPLERLVQLECPCEASAHAPKTPEEEDSRASSPADSDTSSRISFAANLPATFCPLRFAAKLPLLRERGVTEAMNAFFNAQAARSFWVATAYIDTMGAQMLLDALKAGRDVTLLVPRTPNVYTHANRAALSWLLRSAQRTPGRLRALMHPAEMMHAKAAVSFLDESSGHGSVEAILGSANLKARSLTQFGELLARVSGHAALQLRDALAELADESQEVTASARQLWHDPMISAVEAFLG